MANGIHYADLRPGTYVVVHPVGEPPAAAWTAQVVAHHRTDGMLNGNTDVRVVATNDVIDEPPGAIVTVETRALTLGPASMGLAVIDLVRSAFTERIGAAPTSEILGPIESTVQALITSTADHSEAEARRTALLWSATTVANLGHHARGDDRGHKLWWTIWSSIAAHIDLRRCPDCDDSGTRAHEPGMRGNICQHPRISRMTDVAQDKPPTTYLPSGSRFGYLIPARWYSPTPAVSGRRPEPATAVPTSDNDTSLPRGTAS